MPEGVSTLNIILLVVLVLFGAFFSSSEVAFVAQQRVRLHQRATHGSSVARNIESLLNRPGRLLSTILLGNNLANVGAATIATSLAISVLGPEQGVLVATVSVTVIVLIFGELGPKMIAVRFPDLFANMFVYPIHVLAWIAAPIVFALGALGDSAANLFGKQEASVDREGEIRALAFLGSREGSMVPEEAAIVDRVLRFGDRQAREVMTPRPEIVSLGVGTTFAEFLTVYKDVTHSRFPVHSDGLENVVGILHVKDLLRERAEGKISENSSVTRTLRLAYFVPETKSIGAMFKEMRSSHHRIALVVDEHGSVAGLATFKRLVEEIVGDVDDDIDGDDAVTQMDQDSFFLDGGMTIDDARTALNLPFPPGDYQTIAGFLLTLLGHVPEEGDETEYSGLRIKIETTRAARIERVLITREKD